MLKLSAEFQGLAAVNRKLEAIAQGLRPGSPQLAKAADKIQAAILRGHQRMMQDGTDRHGRALAPLSKSTLKNRRRPAGGPLMPGGNQSSFYTGFTITRKSVGGAIEFSVSWSKPYATYHFEGRPKGAKANQPNWSLPKRDVNGLTEKTRQDVNAIAAEALRESTRGANAGTR